MTVGGVQTGVQMRGSELGEHTSCGVEEKQSTTSDGSILFAQPARYPARAMVRVGGEAVAGRGEGGGARGCEWAQELCRHHLG